MQLGLCCLLLSLVFGEPNPPQWPSTVKIFKPGDNGAQDTIDKIFTTQGGHDPPFHGQWSNNRYALLFKPGTYPIDLNIGFYTHVMGMGKSPQDTRIRNVIVENGDFDYTSGALQNFWRAAENFMTTPTAAWNNQAVPSMLWAVSQSSPLRRVYVNGNLNLWQYNYGCCAGYASGGFLADSIVTGEIASASQQQWITRNTNQGSWVGGVWNMVQVGCKGSPPAHCGDYNYSQPQTNVLSTDIIAEKPYIYYNDASDKYYLQIPAIEINKIGATKNYGVNDLSVDFKDVYVTNPTDTASIINGKLSSGIKYIVITPGIYNFKESINVTRSDTVILGIGMPTLRSAAGNVVVKIAANIDGVRISGILLEAGEITSTALLQVGTLSAKRSGSYRYNAMNPTILYDIFARVGGTNNNTQVQVSTISMCDIYNDNVIIDDAWLWRADHDMSGLVVNSNNAVAHGARIFGNNVTTYGLAVEHTLADMVIWSGDYGKAYFYQSEYPYDVTQANYGNLGYVAFRVNGSAFRGWGIGAYCFFRDNAVTVQNGIMSVSDANMINPLTVFLNGKGQITHIWNNKGAAVKAVAEQAYICK
eukprot:519410_1